MSNDTLSISVVIAVYKSSDCLPVLLKQLKQRLKQMGKRFEIILVDDASPDNSWDTIRRLVPRYPFMSAIRLMRNGGQARATLCGMAHAKGETIVTMDDDLQHKPAEMVKLVEALESRPDIDCVFGTCSKKHHSKYRNIGSRIIRRLNTSAVGLPKDANYSSFRVMRKTLVKAILDHRTRNPAISALVFDATDRILSIPVEHAERYSGRSGYTLSKQIRLALDNITNVSMLPLRAVSVMGIGICLASFVYTAFVIICYFYGRITVPGWTTVVILISFFSGTILLSVGIMGEYLVRVLREVRGSPRFVVRETIGFRSINQDRPTGEMKQELSKGSAI